MSSHHIVRDEQEPALVLVESHWNSETLGSLLEWGPVVIVDIYLVDKVIEEGCKLDIVIGEEQDLATSKDKLLYQEPIKYLSKQKEEDTALKAIFYLLSAKHKAVNIFVSVSDQLLQSIEIFLNRIDVVIFDEHVKWIYCKKVVFKKWYAKNRIIQFRKEDIKIISENNCVKISDNTYQVIQEGLIEIQSDHNGFWLGETI